MTLQSRSAVACPGVPLTLDRERDLISQLVDHTVMLSIEAQSVFAERYQGFPWRVDLSDPAVFWFEREPVAMFRPHFVGSTSDATNTWLWGWDNVNAFPGPVVDVARRIHDVGSRFDCVDLITAYQRLDPAERARDGLAVREYPEHAFVYCAQALSGIAAPVYYRAPVSSGYSWFLLDNPDEFALPEPTALGVAFAITRALQTGYVSDHRRAVIAYAGSRAGLSSTHSADAVVVGAADGDVRVAFDDRGRVVSVTTS